MLRGLLLLLAWLAMPQRWPKPQIRRSSVREHRQGGALANPVPLGRPFSTRSSVSAPLPDLDRHVAAAVAKSSGARGWRLDKGHRAAQIDALIALAMAVERAEAREPERELVGWL